MEEFSDIKAINFSNEKQFNDEIESIMNITKDTQLEWTKREESLKKIGGIMLGNFGQSINLLKILNNKLYLNISIQMMNLRSSLTKEASRIVILAAKTYRNQFEQGAEKLISSIVLYKLIASANKVISEQGAYCVGEVIKYVESEKIISKIIEQIKSKNITVRLKSVQFLSYIVENYKKNTLAKLINNIEEFISQSLHDAAGEVRSAARILYSRYNESFSERASDLFDKFDNGVKKAIIDENRKINDKGSSNLTIQTDKTSSVNTYQTEKLTNLSNLQTEENVMILGRHKKNSSNNFEANRNSETIILNSMNIPTTTKSSTTKGKIDQSIFKSSKKALHRASIDVKTNPNTLSPNTNMKTKPILKSSSQKGKEQKGSPLNNIQKTVLSKEDYSPKKEQFKNVEQILLIHIKKSLENDLTQKIASLEFINHLFNEIYCNAINISNSTFKILISLLLDNLTDNYCKIYDQVCMILTKIIYYLPEILESDDINKLVKLVIINISNSEKEISSKANQLMEVIRKKLEGKDIVKSLVEIIQLDTSDDIIIILLEMINILFDKIEELLSDENYLHEFVIKLIKFSVEKQDNKDILYKLFDILEKVFFKYKNAFILGINTIKDEQMRKKLITLLETYKKQIADFVNKHPSSYKMLNITHINKNNCTSAMDSDISFLNDLNLNYNDKNLVNESSLKLDKNCKQFKLFPENYEDVLIKPMNTEFLFLSNSYDSETFMKFLMAEESNLQSFLISLSRVKKEEVLSVFNHLTYAVSYFPSLLTEDMDLFINRVLFISDKFSYSQEKVNQTLMKVAEINSEIYVQIVTRYFSKYEANFIQILLNTFSISAKKIDNENLLFLLPSFIDPLFTLLNHQLAEIRKIAVYCIVDLYFQIGEDFETYINQLSVPQRNLINIYIKKRSNK